VKELGRRDAIRALALSLGSLSALTTTTASAKSNARVVVIGGGIAGTTCARSLKRAEPGLSVTLVEPGKNYLACPLSNLVIGGARKLSAQSFGYAALARDGITHVPLAALAVNPAKRRVNLADGNTLDYDRLVMAPGIDMDYDALPGYSEQAAKRMPHAWKAGEQTTLLARQLAAMRDGGTFVMAVPANPYRCPPGPYERVSLVAHYLRQHKPRSKILVLDSKDRFSKQALFTAAWREHYPNMIDWQGLGDGARVVSVDAKTMSLQTDFDRIKADVANVIPPQRAGRIAHVSGVTDRSGWCPIDALSFESTLVPGIHIIGDAAIANAMPKSAFAANAQAKLCAVQLRRALAGRDPLPSKLINTCYSLLTPEHGISVAGVYSASDQHWLEVEGAGGTSALDATDTVRREEARYAYHWFNTLTQEVFG
jgi:sulfide dehydrogenase [flavocytochrome c] flavoprotein subunit